MKTRVLFGVMIAFCAVVMLSGCGRIKMKTSEKDCASHLKQMAMCILTYVNDHRGNMPSPQALVKGKYLPQSVLDDKKSVIHCPGCGAMYEFLIPENTKLIGVTPATPMLKCPAHGYVVFVDGHVGK